MPLRCLLDGGGNDLRGKRSLPIFGVDIHADGEIAKRSGKRENLRPVDRLRLEIVAVGRTKQGGTCPDGGLDQPLRGVDLKLKALGGGNCGIEMRKGVITDLMALAVDAAKEIGIEGSGGTPR